MPEFYSKRGRADDYKFCVHSRPYKKIHSQRIFPVQTGFVDRLYEKKGVPKSIAQQVEDDAFSAAGRVRLCAAIPKSRACYALYERDHQRRVLCAYTDWLVL